jgi:hypothetical protein
MGGGLKGDMPWRQWRSKQQLAVLQQPWHGDATAARCRQRKAGADRWASPYA